MERSPRSGPWRHEQRLGSVDERPGVLDLQNSHIQEKVAHHAHARTCSLTLVGRSTWHLVRPAARPRDPIYNLGEHIEVHGSIDPNLFEAALPAGGERNRDLTDSLLRGRWCAVADPRAVRRVVCARGRCQHGAGSAGGRRNMNAGRPGPAIRSRPQSAVLLCAARGSTRPVLLASRLLSHRYGCLCVFLIARRVAEVYTAHVGGLPCTAHESGALWLLVEADTADRASEQFMRDRQYWLDRCAGSSEPVRLASHDGHAGCDPRSVSRSCPLAIPALYGLSATVRDLSLGCYGMTGGVGRSSPHQGRRNRASRSALRTHGRRA